MRHKCPYCGEELEEVIDGEWFCPECGESFVDNGYDYPVGEYERMTDSDYDDEDEEDDW